MILFNAKFKVNNKEFKSVPRRDGSGSFDFVEVELETVDDKRPTDLVARLVKSDMDIDVGETYDMRIAVNSNKGRDGRIWNSFTVMSFGLTETQKKEVKEYAPLEVDELPF